MLFQRGVYLLLLQLHYGSGLLAPKNVIFAAARAELAAHFLFVALLLGESIVSGAKHYPAA